MVWGKDRCGAACVRGQLYFRRMRVIRTEKMLIENADMIVCETIHAAQTQPNRNPDLASAVEGARGARPRRGEGRAADLKRLYLAAGACVGVGCPPPPPRAAMRAAMSDELYLAVASVLNPRSSLIRSHKSKKILTDRRCDVRATARRLGVRVRDSCAVPC